MHGLVLLQCLQAPLQEGWWVGTFPRSQALSHYNIVLASRLLLLVSFGGLVLLATSELGLFPTVPFNSILTAWWCFLIIPLHCILDG